MSAPYACEECSRPMYEPRSPQLCAACLERKDKERKKKYDGKRL